MAAPSTDEADLPVARQTHHVFLIPGFLGIESLGEVAYFAHVREVLARELEQLGLDVQLHTVSTYATSSIRKRTLQLLHTIVERVGRGSEPLHLIGHSTGGLDARLLCAPGARLGGSENAEAMVARVRSIVTIACPHRGTPLASFFTTRFGAQLLSLLSLGTFHLLRYGRLPLSVVVRMAALFVRVHSKLGRLEHTVAHQIFERLLGDLSVERSDELSQLLKDVAQDQALMSQLMPEAMDLFDAVVGTDANIRCGSVISGAPGAWLQGILRQGFDPYSQATHALFEALRRLTSEMNEQYLPSLTVAQRDQLALGLGRAPTAQDNDGIAPVLAQVWGEIIHVAQADHFDAIGHFPDAKHSPVHYDWLASGCGFDRSKFELLWRSVACFIARDARTSHAANA